MDELEYINKSLNAVNAAVASVRCPQCLERFTPSRAWQRFCSKDCHNKYHAARAAAATEHYNRCPLAQKEEKANERA